MSEPTRFNLPEVRSARGVLFVCLGNICRSPLARCVFEHMAEAASVRAQLRIDSCGTGHWHVGGPADPRTAAVAARHGLVLSHTARLLDPASDFDRFDLILPMDRSNLTTLLGSGCPRPKAHLFLSFADPSLLPPTDRGTLRTLEVPDPYTGGDDGFEQMYRLVSAASAGLVKALGPLHP